MASQGVGTAPGRMAPRPQGRWARASLLAKSVIVAWVLCALGIAVSVATNGLHAAFAQESDFPAWVPNFWYTFAVGAYSGVVGVVLLLVWLARCAWRRARA